METHFSYPSATVVWMEIQSVLCMAFEMEPINTDFEFGALREFSVSYQPAMQSVQGIHILVQWPLHIVACFISPVNVSLYAFAGLDMSQIWG